MTMPVNPPVPEPAADEAANEAMSKSRQVELLISNLLRFGVLLSLAIIVTGTVVSFVHNPEYVHEHSLERVAGKSAQFPHTIHDVIEGVQNFRGKAIVMLGLIVLIATPVVRVAVSIVGFVYERDRTYVAITTVVLLLLLLSFVLGAVE